MGSGSRDDKLIAAAAVEVTARLTAELSAITAEVQRLVVADIVELRGEEQLQQLLRDTVEANIDTFFTAIKHGIDVENLQPPSVAIEYARRLAERDVSANALVRAYRLGHQAALRAILDEIRATGLEPQVSLDVYDLMGTISFGYIDRISQHVVAAYQQARDKWLETRNTLRAAKVREILGGGGDIDVDAMSIAIRYPLRRTHMALVLWCRESVDELAEMERLVQAFAEAVAAPDAPLFVSMDRVTACAWITLPAAIAGEAVARMRAVSGADGPDVAVGSPLPGVNGFRQSFRQAQDARSVALIAGADGRRFTASSDRGVALAALLAADVTVASTWVREVLGPLAEATEADERLRETLQAFLGSGSSYKAAAQMLHLHANSVKYRVHRAVERRGRAIDDDRLDVEVALLLCDRFGSAVLG
jgi:PucR C-terminal helix-turn-helix domain/GGDEF-like domain